MSGLLRHNPKRDNNEKEVITALEAAGCIVQRLSTKGVPDLLVYHRASDRLILVECKAKFGKLTPEQVKFMEKFEGAPIFIGKHIEGIIKAINQLIEEDR